MISQEAISTLIRLGLTSCQARVFLALVQRGMSPAKEISRSTGMTREDAYRVLPMLEELGLVERMISIPTAFKAIPIQEASSILLQRRIDETGQLQSGINNILIKFKENNEKTENLENVCQFSLIPGKEVRVLKIQHIIMNAKKSIKSFCSAQKIAQNIQFFGESLMKARGRGVKTQLILERTQNEILLDKIDQVFSDVKFMAKPPQTVYSVYDGREMVMAVSTDSNAAKGPALWSNNFSLVKLAENYFETIWSALPKHKKNESFVIAQ